MSLKHDATECTWVVEHGMVSLLGMVPCVGHGMVPLRAPAVFHQLIFPCRHTWSSDARGTTPTTLLVFVENVLPPLYIKD